MNEARLKEEIKHNKSRIEGRKKDMRGEIKKIRKEALEITIDSNPEWIIQKCARFQELQQELFKAEEMQHLLKYLDENQEDRYEKI